MCNNVIIGVIIGKRKLWEVYERVDNTILYYLSTSSRYPSQSNGARYASSPICSINVIDGPSYGFIDNHSSNFSFAGPQLPEI